MIKSEYTSYLEAKILTASSQQLQLMLLEGAIRYGRQAEEAMLRGKTLDAAEPLLRVLDIVGELLVGVRETKSELNTRLGALYLYLFRCVSQAKVNDDVTKLSEALCLLEFERQTWQLVCEKNASERSSTTNGTPAVERQMPTIRRPKIMPILGDASPPASSTGISLEA